MFFQAFFIAFTVWMSACQTTPEPQICVSSPDGTETMMSSSQYQRQALYGKWNLTSYSFASPSTTEDNGPITGSSSMKSRLDKAPRGGHFYITFAQDGSFHYNMDKNSCTNGKFEVPSSNSIHIQSGLCTEMCCDEYEFLYNQATSYYIREGVLELNCGDVSYSFRRVE